MEPGVRRVEVGADRLARWIAGFAERHGPHDVRVEPHRVHLQAADGSSATVLVPYPPLVPVADEPYGGLVQHAALERRIGVLLVRRGGYAAGVFEGPRLVASKVGRRHVQGRSAAGGWSQQRFARRREQQAREAAGAAAEAAVRVLVPELATLVAVVGGGDREMLDLVLADRRLAGLRPLLADRVLPVPDPRRDVLAGCAAALRAVVIEIEETGG